MSIRVAPGHQSRSPFGRAIRDDKEESYKHTVRGINPTSIYDTKFEGYRNHKEHKPNVFSAVLIVILIVVAIILFAYIIHCARRGITRDPGYFDKITVFGGKTCPACGNNPCTCNAIHEAKPTAEPPVNDMFDEVTPQTSNVIAGATDDYLTGGADKPEDRII